MPDSHANPYGSPEALGTEHAPQLTRSTERSRCLAAFYAIGACWGGSQVIAFDNATTYAGASLLLAAAATSWAIADARADGRSFRGTLRVVYFLFWPFASLVYLSATRKIRGIGWWLLNAVGIYGSVTLTFYVLYYLLFSVGRYDLIDPMLVDYTIDQ